MDYIFYPLTCPFATRIYPTLDPETTLKLLYEISASRPVGKHLPTEILLDINDELHKNALRDKIRSNWSPTIAPIVLYQGSDLGYFGIKESPLRAALDTSKKTYFFQENCDIEEDLEAYLYSAHHISHHVSSADLLYRLLCYFPETTVNSDLDRYNVVWEACIRHKHTGILLLFGDFKGAASVKALHDKESKYRKYLDSKTVDDMFNSFSEDALQLLSGFFGRTKGSKRFAFYHPAAEADRHGRKTKERFIAVPYEITREAEDEDDDYLYLDWKLTKTSLTDVSNFRSIVKDLKYDIKSRELDRSNGTANLTTVISSSLLFYRLICKYLLGHQHRSVNNVSPITSIWQVQLVHHMTGDSIIFMDDRGLFDIRVGENFQEESMMDVDRLVGQICSDYVEHPIEDILAGCHGNA